MGQARTAVKAARDARHLVLDAERDERVLAEIVNRSPRKHGNGRQYFERVMAEIDKDRKAKRTAHQDVIGQHARDRWDFAQIKVSMAGKSSGSKFTNHHAGD